MRLKLVIAVTAFVASTALLGQARSLLTRAGELEGLGRGEDELAYLPPGSQRLSTGRRRYEGFVTAMRERGLEPAEALTRFSDAFTEAEGARVCRELLDGGPEVTAIIAGNDLMALGCYDVLAERGLECPRDVSVVGFNDMPFADRFQPPLTTVRIPHYEIGASAAAMLLRRLQAPDEVPEQLLLEPELVVRSSTAAPG